MAILPALLAVRLAIALTLGASTDPAILQHALVLDPANAAIEHRLGMAIFYSESSTDREAALEHLRRAAGLAPRGALYWSDLASACESMHDAACADEAVGRSLKASPMTPRLYWSAANYDLRAGRRSEALGTFRHLLKLDPGYADATFRVCLQMLGSSEVIEQGILATDRNPHVSMAFVNLASAMGDDDSAFAEWQRLVSADYANHAEEAGPATNGAAPLRLAQVEPYLDRLIDSGRESESVEVWSDLERLGVVRTPGESTGEGARSSRGSARESELVFNGGFEEKPLNGGFDWRYKPEPFVSVSRSSTTHSGEYSLRIEFTGDRNQEYEPAFEVVPVQPDRSYMLSAFVRSESMRSDTGPRLRVREFECGSAPCLDAASADVTSTTPWHATTLDFTTGPRTHFVRLSIWRPRSRGYPAEISGVVWLDDVSIIARPTEAAARR